MTLATPAWALASAALGKARGIGSPHIAYPAGRFMTPLHAAGVAVGPLTPGMIYAHPIMFATPTPCDAMGIFLGVGVAASFGVFGLYSVIAEGLAGVGLPGDLVAQVPQVSTAASAVELAQPFAAVTPVLFGAYYIAQRYSAAVTVRGMSQFDTSTVSVIGSGSMLRATSPNLNFTCLTAGGPYSPTLPAVFPAGPAEAAIASPLCGVRVAA